MSERGEERSSSTDHQVFDRTHQRSSTVTHASLLVVVIRLDTSEPHLHYLSGMTHSKKKVGYQQFPEAEADEEDTTVLHSAGTVSNALQIPCLYASGVRAPEYRTPLMNSIGETLAWSLPAAASSAFSRVMPSEPSAQVSIFALSMESAAVVFFWQESRTVAFRHDG
jgi:hypothetical protein